MKESIWNRHKLIEFDFEGKHAKLVVPERPLADGKWLFKTEYFGAFPTFELAMLDRGYHVAHVDNTTRWCLPEDTDRQARFAEFLHREYRLHQRCVPVGMSCGGMQAVYLASKYPQLIAALYLDAPVLNLLSCPCGVGLTDDHMYEEFMRATGKTVSELINFRDHPIDRTDILLKNNIPIFLVCGADDHTVPYPENGKILLERYKAAGGTIQAIVKPGCDHHPHGTDDSTPLIAFVEKYYK